MLYYLAFKLGLKLLKFDRFAYPILCHKNTNLVGLRTGLCIILTCEP
jgi:hypothetical protein